MVTWRLLGGAPARLVRAAGAAHEIGVALDGSPYQRLMALLQLRCGEARGGVPARPQSREMMLV